MTKGVYGLSNASLNSPWPKLNQGVKTIQDYCRSQSPLEIEILFQLLRDQTQADEEQLPDTGIDRAQEKQLSSIFIQSAQYGTRSSTILMVDNNHNLHWQERIFSPEAKMQQEVIFNCKLC